MEYSVAKTFCIHINILIKMIYFKSPAQKLYNILYHGTHHCPSSINANCVSDNVRFIAHNHTERTSPLMFRVNTACVRRRSSDLFVPFCISSDVHVRIYQSIVE